MIEHSQFTEDNLGILFLLPLISNLLYPPTKFNKGTSSISATLKGVKGWHIFGLYNLPNLLIVGKIGKCLS
jgi:hypothetical protein